MSQTGRVLCDASLCSAAEQYIRSKSCIDVV